MQQMGKDSFEKLKQQEKVSTNQAANTYVSCVSHRVLKAMGEKPSDWEVVVFEDKSPNAFALPGKKIGVHTGMIDLAQNPDQLAAVIGHEIGHVLASHGNERVSQNIVAQGTMAAASLAIGQDTTKDQLLIAALGVGAQVGVLLPFSRKHETEADLLGLKYMSKAGFNPQEAANLWVQMKQKAGGSPPEFLSTHPSPDSRIKTLRKEADKYRSQYKKNDQNTQCSKPS
tara:strand:+ start:14704 stop:15387 length:684 start_codon:yes stop_codon:yes gene_type:complete